MKFTAFDAGEAQQLNLMGIPQVGQFDSAEVFILIF